VAEVRQGRKAMVKQLSTMGKRIWQTKRHTCENFSPAKNGNNDECTGCQVHKDLCC